MNKIHLQFFTIATFAALGTGFAPKAHADLEWLDANLKSVDAAIQSHDYIYLKNGEKVDMGTSDFRRQSLKLALEKEYKLPLPENDFYGRLKTLNKYLSMSEKPKKPIDVIEVLFMMNTALAIEKAMPGTYKDGEVLMIKQNIEDICDTFQLADIHRLPFEISPREFAFDPNAAGVKNFKEKYKNLSVEEIGKAATKHATK